MKQATLFDPAPDLATFFSRLHLVTDKRSLTHTLHPYPAKFVPQIPRALLEALARPGMPVLDPMCGSGTTLVEAAVAGFPAVGVDLNPIAALVSQAKTTVLGLEDRECLSRLVTNLYTLSSEIERDPEGIRERVDALDVPEFANSSRWFVDHVMAELALVRDLAERLDSAAARVVALASFSAIIVGVSNQESETTWRHRPSEVAPGETARRFAVRLSAASRGLAEYSARGPAPVRVFEADARSLPLDAGSIGTVVTSPPYANSHDYYLYNKLRLFWLRRDVAPIQEAEIGSRNRHSDKKEGIETYQAAMTAVCREVRRVLVPGGYFAIVVADAVIRGLLIPMRALYERIAEDVGLTLQDAYDFDHRRFNSTFQRGFGTQLQKRTHVLVFR